MQVKSIIREFWVNKVRELTRKSAEEALDGRFIKPQ